MLSAQRHPWRRIQVQGAYGLHIIYIAVWKTAQACQTIYCYAMHYAAMQPFGKSMLPAVSVPGDINKYVAGKSDFITRVLSQECVAINVINNIIAQNKKK
jgi:hypothetical protein